ncbi:hypothetical protein [Arenimonas composti]|nr:hypothetical protein [Arenimonas composti]
MLSRLLPVLMLLAGALPAVAIAASDALIDPAVLDSPAFLAGHPDLRFRREGFAAYDRGRHRSAVEAFRKAARYADKPSQGMLAEMYANGDGVPADPALAWAWMALAAERGPAWAEARREAYLARVPASELARADALFAEMLGEYGDEVARPRLATHLRRAARGNTGSRVGGSAPRRVQLVSGDGVREVRDVDFDDPRYWEPERYFALQDAEWARFRGGD